MSSKQTGDGQSVARGNGRRLLLESARALFAERGYAGTSTREIARAASVSEPMIFRHFGSKVKLFEEAVLDPFTTFLSDYIADWAARRPRGVTNPYMETREFYRGVYDVLSANRRLLHEMIHGRANGSLPADTVSVPQLGTLLERFEDIIKHERDLGGFRDFDPAVVTRLMFGMVFSLAVHGDLMFEGATRPRPSIDAFIDEMARLTIYGAYPEGARRPAAP